MVTDLDPAQIVHQPARVSSHPASIIDHLVQSCHAGNGATVSHGEIAQRLVVENGQAHPYRVGTVMGAAEIAGHINGNPVRTTRLPRRAPVQERLAIAPDKIRELLASLPEPSRSIAWLLVLTGMRVGELLALRWRDVDLEQRLVRVRQTVYEGTLRRTQNQTQQSHRSARSEGHGDSCGSQASCFESRRSGFRHA